MKHWWNERLGETEKTLWPTATSSTFTKCENLCEEAAGTRAQVTVILPLSTFPAFEIENRRSDKGDTATRIKCPIAAKCKALKWRGVLVTLRVPMRLSECRVAGVLSVNRQQVFAERKWSEVHACVVWTSGGGLHSFAVVRACVCVCVQAGTGPRGTDRGRLLHVPQTSVAFTHCLPRRHPRVIASVHIRHSGCAPATHCDPREPDGALVGGDASAAVGLGGGRPLVRPPRRRLRPPSPAPTPPPAQGRWLPLHLPRRKPGQLRLPRPGALPLSTAVPLVASRLLRGRHPRAGHLLLEAAVGASRRQCSVSLGAAATPSTTLRRRPRQCLLGRGGGVPTTRGAVLVARSLFSSMSVEGGVYGDWFNANTVTIDVPSLTRLERVINETRHRTRKFQIFTIFKIIIKHSRAQYYSSLVAYFKGRRGGSSGDIVARALASHHGYPDSIPGGLTPGFCMYESCLTMPLAGGFSRSTTISPALAFQHRSILGSHSMPCPGMMTCTYGSQLESPSLGGCRLALIKAGKLKTQSKSNLLLCKSLCGELWLALNSEVLRANTSKTWWISGRVGWCYVSPVPENLLLEDVEDVRLDAREVIWLQRDGAPPHLAIAVRWPLDMLTTVVFTSIQRLQQYIFFITTAKMPVITAIKIKLYRDEDCIIQTRNLLKAEMVADNKHKAKSVHIRVERGATVAERLARPPPTKTNRSQSPAGSLRIFACGNRAGRCRWSAGFLEDLPFPPPFHSGAALYSLQLPSSTLKTSLLRAVQISSLHFTVDRQRGSPMTVSTVYETMERLLNFEF
ncbi:hypothetical protein PR048_020002 [Dryococelus australis]|uniref:Uncharacterized protein n=1 Tax=Dryococelus australis TaxID=614101 RepID=A0ABQ9H524_9NEOP|nr:hypothetical protein PR048_020002 [Dryococelus australis]